jgi:hypothetical protein
LLKSPLQEHLHYERHQLNLDQMDLDLKDEYEYCTRQFDILALKILSLLKMVSDGLHIELDGLKLHKGTLCQSGSGHSRIC